MKRRIISIITALALCLSLCPAWAFAAEADPALCKHHPEHTEDCGYIAPTEGRDCGHEHTEDCYTLGVLPDADGSNPYEVGADTENLLDGGLQVLEVIVVPYQVAQVNDLIIWDDGSLQGSI